MTVCAVCIQYIYICNWMWSTLHSHWMKMDGIIKYITDVNIHHAIPFVWHRFEFNECLSTCNTLSVFLTFLLVWINWSFRNSILWFVVAVVVAEARLSLWNVTSIVCRKKNLELTNVNWEHITPSKAMFAFARHNGECHFRWWFDNDGINSIRASNSRICLYR